MVYYLLYRPKKFSELDSKDVREKLEKTLKGKIPEKIPHAYLFTGARGLGKTSTARIIAKAINCTNRKAGKIEPCNKCKSCISINSSSNLDVIEIDAASNRGIDEIRDLREKIRLSPVQSYKKIYIVDEAHMLTTEAFNALLKTLEEPPSHAYFILCTTEDQKVPETIKSRCFQLSFRRATTEELVSSFQRIVKGEKLKAKKDALLEIAHLSDGSFRDGAKILEELSSATNISLNVIEKRYKSKSISLYTKELIDALFRKDAKESMEIIKKLNLENVDIKLFSEKLISDLHTRLAGEVENNDNRALATRDLIALIAKSFDNIKYSPISSLPLELAIVEWSYGQVESSEYKVLSTYVDSKKEANSQSAKAKKSGGKPTKKDDKILEELIESVKKENFSIAGVLRGCLVEKYDNKSLTLSTSYKFHRERLADKKIIEMLETSLFDITGKKTEVSIILKE